GPDLRLLTLGTGEETVVEAQPWPDSPPAFSSDGARLAFTSRAEERLRVVVYTFATGATEVLSDGAADAYDPRFDPGGRWLSFAEAFGDGTAAVRRVVARDLALGGQVEVHRDTDLAQPTAQVAVHQWTGDGRLAVAEDSATWSVYGREAGTF